MSIGLAEPCINTFLNAEDDGVWLRNKSIDLGDFKKLSELKPKYSPGSIAAYLIPQMVELGIATIDNKANWNHLP